VGRKCNGDRSGKATDWTRQPLMRARVSSIVSQPRIGGSGSICSQHWRR
jgi:hypothetical protein